MSKNETTEAEVRALARETYNKTRAGHPHMPHPDTTEGQRKLDRLFDIMWKHVQRPPTNSFDRWWIGRVSRAWESGERG